MNNLSKGKISQIIGAVIDVYFEDNQRIPNIYEALEIHRDNHPPIVLECQQDIGERTVRTIAMDSTDGLSRGMEVLAMGQPISMPVGPEINGRLFNVTGQAIDGMPQVAYTRRDSIHRNPPKFEELTTSQE
ncbi:MAG: F0F1 ATP synthase subunit beta, partial [Bacteroidales bacterium]